MQSKHMGEKPFRCAICEKKFIQKSNLNQHFTTHAKQRPFRCDKCRREFSKEGDKKAHEKLCKRRQYQCYLCKDVMHNSMQWNVHNRNHQTREKPKNSGNANMQMKNVHLFISVCLLIMLRMQRNDSNHLASE